MVLPVVRRLIPTVIVLCMLLSIMLLLGLAAAPGWRHRHTGEKSHSHARSHAHGHSHSHSHGHSHSHSHDHASARNDGQLAHLHDGWHIHLSIFGFELTLWDPWASEAVAAVNPVNTLNDTNKKSEGGGLVTVSAAEGTAGWISLFLIDWGPIPKRIASPIAVLGNHVSLVAACEYSFARQAPPSPPPECI